MNTNQQIVRYYFFTTWVCFISLIVFWMVSQMWAGKDTRTLLAEMQAQELAATNSLQHSPAGDVSQANEFTTVYELTAGGIRARALFHLGVALVLVIGGIVGLFIRRKRIHRGVFVVLSVVGMGWFSEHMALLDLANSDIKGNTQVVEGIVHVSRVAGYHKPGSGDEISVGGRTFHVDSHAPAGYKQMIVRGGVLRGGVYARIHRADESILKIEVRGKPPDQPTTLTNVIFWGLASTLFLLVLGAVAFFVLIYLKFLRPCLNNLRQIAAAKELWAAANRKTNGEAVVVSEVNQHIKDHITPICPRGGTYSYNCVGESPTCSCSRKQPHSARQRQYVSRSSRVS